MSESLSDSASPEDHITLEEKPYHSKRPHKKSRSGCKNCKARKVKCDEARPTCRSCRLRKTECVYPSPPPASTAAPTRSSTSPTKSSSSEDTVVISTDDQDAWWDSDTANPPTANSSALVASTKSHEFFSSSGNSRDIPVVVEPMFRPAVANDEFDMRLLWFYTTATCSSFSVECGHDRPVETVMRTRIVQHAFQTPFLMQSLFALSALHLQSLDQKIDQSRALSYRATSFAGYRKAVEDADPETFPALIANSLLLTALSSQAFRDPDAKDLYIIDWMIVWRGIGVMINLTGFDKLASSGLGTLFHRPGLDLDAAAYSVPNQLLFMVSSIGVDDPEYADVDTYFEALKYVGALYVGLNQEGLGPITNLRIVTWFTFIPAPFVELGRQQRPRALIILAYYAAYLKIAQSIWWLKGIGQRTLRDITQYLGPEWSSHLKIPMLAMGTDDPTKLSRILLDDPEWTSPAWPDPNDDTLSQAIADLSWVDNHGKKCEFSDEHDSHAVVVEGDRAGQDPWCG